MALPTPSIFLKRGSTFSLGGYVTIPAGEWVATSEVKDNYGALIAELEVTLQSPPVGETRWPILLYWADTSEWPLGPLNCDIRFVSGTNIVYSPTFIVNMVKEVTDPQPTLVLRGP